jgi:hypothetical protein
MNPTQILEKLREISSSGDYSMQSAILTQEWSRAPDGLDAVDPILQFMEANPNLDFGLPGPLVHFVEQYYGSGYEGKLVASVDRTPTLHTVWMLNRVINGTADLEQRQLLIQTLTRATINPSTDSKTRQQASRLMDRLSAK